MSNPFQGFSGRKRKGLERVKVSGGNQGNTLEAIILRDILSREEEKRKPKVSAEVTSEETTARELAQKKVSIEGAYKGLRDDLLQMRDLTLQVENVKPGVLERIKGITRNTMSVLRQDMTGVLLNRYDRIKNSALRNMAVLRSNETESRFSDADAQRMGSLFGNPIRDTELQEDLDFAENARNLDSKAKSAGVVVEKPLFDEVFPGNLQPRKSAAKIMLGDLIRQPDSISDDELKSGSDFLYNSTKQFKNMPKVMKEMLLKTLEERGLDV